MFNYKMPFSGNTIGNIKNDMKLSETSLNVEAGSFLTAAIEGNEGVAKLGSTASTDQFLGIALNNSLGTQVAQVVEGVIPEDKIVELPFPVVASSELVKVDGTVKTVTTDYTVSGTTLTFVASSITAGQKFKIVYKREVTVAELENLQYGIMYPRGEVQEGYIDVALSGEFYTTCFDSTCDFESSSVRKIDANGCLTTTGSGVDVSDRVIILELPNAENGCMKVRVIG